MVTLHENPTVISPKELLYLLNDASIKACDDKVAKSNDKSPSDALPSNKSDEIIALVRDEERRLFCAEWDSGYDLDGSPAADCNNEDQILTHLCHFIDDKIREARQAAPYIPSKEKLESFRKISAVVPENLIEFYGPQPV